MEEDLPNRVVGVLDTRLNQILTRVNALSIDNHDHARVRDTAAVRARKTRRGKTDYVSITQRFGNAREIVAPHATIDNRTNKENIRNKYVTRSAFRIGYRQVSVRRCKF
jgi:hypothetical protein